MNREQLFSYFNKYDEDAGVEYWGRNDDDCLLIARGRRGYDVMVVLINVYPVQDGEPKAVLVYESDAEQDAVINVHDKEDIVYEVEVFVKATMFDKESA